MKHFINFSLLFFMILLLDCSTNLYAQPTKVDSVIYLLNKSKTLNGLDSSSMAHEIQNPLNFVNNFSELSVELVDEIVSAETEEEKNVAAKTLIENLEKINQHGKRASSIISQLQEHSNKGTAHEYFESPQPAKGA